MKQKKFSISVGATLAAAAMVSTSAVAAPIFSQVDTFSQTTAGFNSAAQAPLFSNMRLNGGHHQTVAFLGDDNSILIGHYARGPWSKNEFLRSWQNVGGGNDFLPPVETVSALPEPSTLALLGVGLLALGLLRRRQTNT